MTSEMAYSDLNNGIKKEQTTTHFHDLLHEQLSAEDSRNIDNNDSAEESGESPLDFSIKRKPHSSSYDEVSGSDSLSSPASSFNDTGGNLEERKNDADGGTNNKSSLTQGSPPDRSPLFHHKQFKNEQTRHPLSPVHEHIGQPKPDTGSGPGFMPNMFHELHMGLANANMLASSFPAMAALMDPRRFSGNQKHLGMRAFKGFTKDNIPTPADSGAIPHYLSSFANFENSAIMQGLNLSSDEIFKIYKQQLLALRDREKYLDSIKLSQELAGRGSSTATTSSPGTSLPPSLSAIHLTSCDNAINNNISSLGNISNKHSPIGVSASQTSSGESDSTFVNMNALAHSPALSPLTAGGRRRPRSLPDEQKDDAYWERRRKNNEAAKRSRDARRAKEEQIAIRAALLEQENLKLRVEVAALKTETAKLRCMLYNS